jgi:hypothetical protein
MNTLDYYDAGFVTAVKRFVAPASEALSNTQAQLNFILSNKNVFLVEVAEKKIENGSEEHETMKKKGKEASYVCLSMGTLNSTSVLLGARLRGSTIRNIKVGDKSEREET